jgi:hypothetical protein
MPPSATLSAFWRLPENVKLLLFKNEEVRIYTPGKVVKMAIVEAPNEVAAFISEIGIAAYFTFNDDKIFRESIKSIPDASNDSAVNRYIAKYGVTPGFTFKLGKTPASPHVPVRRDNLTEEQKRQSLKQRSTSFTLPNVSPPDYVASRHPPPDLARFESRCALVWRTSTVPTAVKERS